MQAYKIMSVDGDGKPLPLDQMFKAWVQLAGELSEQMPDGVCRQLCEAVYEAVTRDAFDAT